MWEISSHLTPRKWKAELALLADLQWTVYPYKWLTISCRSDAGQGKYTGQRPTFYHWATLELILNKLLYRQLGTPQTNSVQAGLRALCLLCRTDDRWTVFDTQSYRQTLGIYMAGWLMFSWEKRLSERWLDWNWKDYVLIQTAFLMHWQSLYQLSTVQRSCWNATWR